jgi:hypothetical protein
MKIIVVQVLVGAKRESLEEIVLAPNPENNDLVARKLVHLLDAEPMEISVTHTLISMNLSLFITQGATHVATVMCNWRDVAPYFAIRLMDGAFVEFYFEK